MILPVAKMEEFPSLIDLATRRTASFEAVHNADPEEHCDGRQAAQLALQRPLAIGGVRR